MVLESKNRYTPENYLALERKADYLSEYFNGEVTPMPPKSANHRQIIANLAAALETQLKGRSCVIYPGNMRVKSAVTGLYTYPDMIIACASPQFEDDHADTLLNPSVIFEVLAESGDPYEHDYKFFHYRRMDSLKEYLPIYQDRHLIEHYIRQTEKRWALTEAQTPDTLIELPSISCAVKLGDVYNDVVFEEPSEEDDDTD